MHASKNANIHDTPVTRSHRPKYTPPSESHYFDVFSFHNLVSHQADPEKAGERIMDGLRKYIITLERENSSLSRAAHNETISGLYCVPFSDTCFCYRKFYAAFALLGAWVLWKKAASRISRKKSIEILSKKDVSCVTLICMAASRIAQFILPHVCECFGFVPTRCFRFTHLFLEI